MKPKILVVGTGAIGSFYGGKLSLTDCEVSTLSRSDYDVVKETGISIKSVGGDFIFRPHKIIKRASEYNDTADFIIVTTKVLPEIDISKIIGDAVSEKTSIVLLQNGIDIEKDVVKFFPNNEIISALAFICVTRTDYGKIYHEDYGRITLGKFPGGDSLKGRQLVDLFNKVDVPAVYEEDIVKSRWLKLLWNAPFNPLSVICNGATTKEMIENEDILKLVKNSMQEIVALSKHDNHPLDSFLIEKNIEDTKKMRPYKTSMLVDYENKRPLEVEAILGNTLKIAEKYNVKTPYLQGIYSVLSFLNKQK